jgi:hypothetical protein
VTDIVERLRREVVWESEVGDVLSAAADEIERLRGDAEVSRLRLAAAHAEIERLRLAIRRLADQDATLSVQGGSVIVDIECQDLLQKNLTAEERVAIGFFADIHADDDPPHEYADTLRLLLERLK